MNDVSKLPPNSSLLQSPDVRYRIIAMFVLLAVANVGAWVWAFTAFRNHPLLLGTALLAYGLGLRHALDADHIAAIDNVTRKLMNDGRRPVAVGFFFSLGHSTVVVAASVAIALTASAITGSFPAFANVGRTIGTVVSATFLLAIAIMNLVIFLSIYRTFHRVRTGAALSAAELEAHTSGGGVIARMFRPLFRMINKSWHMYPLGLLFGLGFDTATEVALLGISATEAARGLPIWSIMVFPALFTAGMSLVDSADSVLMLGAYGHAFTTPLRKLYYNMTITLVSAVVAILVGTVQALGFIVDRQGLEGPFWSVIVSLNDNFGNIGYLIVGLFIVSWMVSAAVFRFKRYDQHVPA